MKQLLTWRMLVPVNRFSQVQCLEGRAAGWLARKETPEVASTDGSRCYEAWSRRHQGLQHLRAQQKKKKAENYSVKPTANELHSPSESHGKPGSTYSLINSFLFLSITDLISHSYDGF